MKLFLSGPMTGYESFNIPAFDAAAELLRAKGHEVVNPPDISRRMLQERGLSNYEDIAYEDYMAADFAELVTCDAVVLLAGWVHSSGSRREVMVAHAHQIPVIGKYENLWGLLLPASESLAA